MTAWRSAVLVAVVAAFVAGLLASRVVPRGGVWLLAAWAVSGVAVCAVMSWWLVPHRRRLHRSRV